MNNVELTAGRLLCRPIREYLNRAQFLGTPIEYIEGGGLFEHTFTIKGPDDAVRRIVADIKSWMVENDIKEATP